MSPERDSNGRFVPGATGNAGGRPAGTPNKVTAEIRQMLRQALEETGGVQYLVEQAQANPVAFLGLIGRLIPAEIRASITGVESILYVRDYSGLSGDVMAGKSVEPRLLPRPKEGAVVDEQPEEPVMVKVLL